MIKNSIKQSVKTRQEGYLLSDSLGRGTQEHKNTKTYLVNAKYKHCWGDSLGETIYLNKSD